MRFSCLTFSMLLLWAACSLGALQARGQDRDKPLQGEDVIRVDTVLVQTDVMVLDKSGNFINGLNRNQFALKIDGKRKDISFFELVHAGSRNEEAQLAAARGSTGNRESPINGALPLDRGRTVFFLADDLHLSPSSVSQTRAMLTRFVDREMGQNDEAAITSTSGQIGFLQQLTDERAVLHAAIERLKPRPSRVQSIERPPMSEYQALKVDANDNDVVGFFVDQLLRDNPLLDRRTAEEMVHSRASQILHEAAWITTNTLATVESLVRNSRQLPGRKVLFLISDGFFLDSRNSDAYERLRRITSFAATTGMVIYSIDARGLVTGMEDASVEGIVDPSGRLQRGSTGELTASQDVLNALAADTGGRAFFNSNALSVALTTALKESSTYYLLAWRPDNEEERNPKFRRVEVSVVGRRDLVVRFRRGFGQLGAAEAASLKNQPTQPIRKQPTEQLADAIKAAYAKTVLPVALTLNFTDVPQYGTTLVASLKVSTNSLVLRAATGLPAANLDIAGVLFDVSGKSVSTFNKHLTITAKSGKAPPDSVSYNHFAVVKPGLYQVRVAALGEKQGQVGSAVRWIEIPDVGSKLLAMSSLIVGEKKPDTDAQPSEGDNSAQGKAADPFREVGLNVEHRFGRSSRLRFLAFVYNAAGGDVNASPTTNTIPASSNNGARLEPDIAVQVQVFRDNEPVITTPLHKIETEGVTDFKRVPYAADVLLSDLQPGRYVLQVTVIDRLAKASTSQKYDFQVD